MSYSYKFSPESIEIAISQSDDPFSREDYEAVRARQFNEIVDFDDFLSNVAESVTDNDGTIEDAVFIAVDAFKKFN